MGSLIRRSCLAAAGLGILLNFPAAGAQATTRGFLGVGLSLPAGDFDSYANPGFVIGGALERSFGRHPTALRLDLSYAANLDTTAIGFHETTKLTTAMVNFVYHFEGSHPHLYALAGIGALRRTFSSDDPDDIPLDETDVAIQFGEGVYARIGRVKLYLEGRFITTTGPGPFRYFPVMIGVRF